jgi:hypothetical protein
MARKKPIISPLGQWAYPGEVTVIPSSNITMKGVNYPVLGIDDLGNQQMMMPGGEYDFPGNYVTEYPQMNKGGQMIKRKDGSYSKRGLWDNIRANKGSGKKPTKEMLEQERKIKAKMQNGGWLDQYQGGGVRPPIYTSDFNDPRLQRFNDSLYNYNLTRKYPQEGRDFYKEERVNSTHIRPRLAGTVIYPNNIRGQMKPIRWDNYVTGAGFDERIPEYSVARYKKPVQPYVYRKPEVVPEAVETPVVEPPKPSLAVSNIDRDMYTPGGGMAREYNIGVTLQDGNRKSFRTEKEYQDWKTANNLDISNAKVSEGRGYSYNYPENKKYGGWLNKYQTGGRRPLLSFDNDQLNKVRSFGYIPNLSDDYQDFISRDDNNFYYLEYQPDIEKYEPFKITKKRSLWDKIAGKYRNVTGKYDKLKDSEEFKDAQLNSEIRNTFKDYDPQFRDSLNWTLDYMNSPNYKKNLMRSVKADINRNDYSSDEEYNQVVKDRFLNRKDARLSNLQTIPDVKPFDINIDHTGSVAWSESDTGQIRTEPSSINAEKISKYNYINSYVYPHEISHSVDRPNNNELNPPGEGWNTREIPEKDLKEMSSRLKIVPTSDYDKYIADPSEVRARLNATRRDFFDRGIDVFTKPINIKDVKDKNEVPIGIEDLQRIYKDEDILWMLNNISKNEEPKLNIAKYGGWLNKYQTGGPETSTEQNPDRMQAVDIRKKRSWSDKLRGFINQGEKAIGLDPYNERSDDFMEQWARRVNDATGGRDWYKQPNDASGTGGIGTAMMETVMAPFSAPQLASVYGATGKVQMPSEAMNIQNPYLAFGVNAVTDPLSYVGAGLTRTGQKFIKGLSAAAELRGPLKSAGKYLTTNTPLKNTYKYNPLAFKPNPEAYYRVMPDAGAEDLINSGFVRPAEGSPTSYFNKGVPLDIRRARTFGTDTREAYHGYKGPYMVESNNPKAFDPWLQFPEPSLKFYQTKAPIPSSDIKLYKEDWLQGYKPVDVSSAGQMSITPPVGGHIKNIAKELLGLTRNPGNKAAIAEGNTWLKNWIDDPVTQAKIDTDLGWIPQRGNVLKDKFDLGYEQAKSFRPNTKEYPISNQIQDLGESLFLKNPNEHMHAGNKGISNLYNKSPLERNLIETSNTFDPKYGSFVSRNPSISQNQRALTTTHEGTHDWASDFLLNESGQKKDILNLLSPDTKTLGNQFRKLRNQGVSSKQILKTMGKENAYKGYFADPAETHAKIMEIRKAFNMTPEQSRNLTPGQAKNIMNILDRGENVTNINPTFLDVIDRDPKKLATLFNRLWAVPAVAAASQLPEQRYGGWLDTYQDGGENLPQLNSKIDIANFYKNSLSEKYGIYQDPTDKAYKYYAKTKETAQPKEEYRQLPDLSNIDKQKLKEINAKKASLSETQLSNIQPVSPVILPKQRDQILRDKLYYDQDALMEQVIREFPIASPSYKEVLESIPKIEESKTRALPNKQKPAKAELNKNIELNPVQQFYADRMYNKYGKVILTDKANNRTIYGTKKADGTWDLNDFEVLSGQASNFNEISGLSVKDLAKFKNKRGTPIGVFPLRVDEDLYGYPGLRLDGSGNIAYHVTYKGADDMSRDLLYNNNNALDNYRSYGCINCQKPSLEKLLKFAKPNDKALIINSNLGFKNNENWIKKNTPDLYNDLFKKEGGQTSWLNKYK